MQTYAINSSFFLHFVTKTCVFATSVLVIMSLNLICYILHIPLLFPLFTHSSCFSLVPFESHLFTLSLLSLVPFELRSSLKSCHPLTIHLSLPSLVPFDLATCAYYCLHFSLNTSLTNLVPFECLPRQRPLLPFRWKDALGPF